VPKKAAETAPDAETGVPAKAPSKGAAKKAAPAPEPEAAADDSTESEVVMNRAERRAKGKGKGQPQPSSRGKVIGGHGPASTQRMWSNRRSGG